MKNNLFAGLKVLAAMLLGCFIFLGTCYFARSADELSKMDAASNKNIMCLDATSTDMSNLYCSAGTHNLNVNLAGGAVTTTIYSPTTFQNKKTALGATTESGVLLYPAAASYVVKVINESDNDIYVYFGSATASVTVGELIKAYGSAGYSGVTISALRAYNSGADAATVSVSFWR